MSEGQSQVEIYENLSKIRKAFDENKPKTDPLGLSEESFKVNSSPTEVSKNLDKKPIFNLPSAEKLHSDEIGVSKIVEGVLVQADILSKRADGRPDTRDSFKKVVDKAIENNVITREKLTELTFHRQEEHQNKLVKESTKIIDEVQYEISEINKILEKASRPEDAVDLDIVILQDNRQRLIALSTQINDSNTLAEIDKTIEKITQTIDKVIEIINLEIDKQSTESNDKDELKLELGKYRISLLMPNIGSRLCNVEVVDLKDGDEEIQGGEKGVVTGRQYKVGNRVARVTYMHKKVPNTRTYFLDEIKYLNQDITAENFEKIEPEKT